MRRCLTRLRNFFPHERADAKRCSYTELQGIPAIQSLSSRILLLCYKAYLYRAAPGRAWFSNLNFPIARQHTQAVQPMQAAGR
jgi:hypothetical protein